MEIKSLSKEVISKIRSTSNINNLSQCVIELVLNSLDAKSSAVAVRLNSLSFRIQVVDNGTGISNENLEKIALKYFTSKCHSLLDFEKNPKTYGYKGESLWSISNVCKSLTINSKYSKCENTFTKIISRGKHGKVTLVKKRQSNGTTVTIEGLFNDLPVRQKRMKKEFEFEEVINFLRSMSIIHPQVSITLRDDITGKILFERSKHQNVIQSFINLYPDIEYEDTIVMKVQKDKIRLEALLIKEVFKSKPIQYIFVNKRPLHHEKLHGFLCKEISKYAKKKIQPVNNFHPTFVLNIKCSLSKYSIAYENSRAKVEFLNMDIIYRCVEKLVMNFLGKSQPIKDENKIDKNRKSVCGVSDLGGAVKGFGFKDWMKKKVNDEGTELIEDITEQNESLKESVKKHGNSGMKIDKLKSLPIKISELNHNKPTDRQNKQKINNIKNQICQFIEERSYNNDEAPFQNAENQGRIMMENFHRLERNCKHILSKQKPEETLFSNFTNTEEKGKDFLMYMFLKSTEMFSGNTIQHTSSQICEDSSIGHMNNSVETIMESNIFFQNITNTKNRHLSENISVSVRLKRRKNVKTHKKQSLFSEKYTFSKPVVKKRRTDPLREKHKNYPKNENFLKSPYFKSEIVDRKYDTKKGYIEKQNEIDFLIRDDLKTDMFITQRYEDKNLTILNSCFSKTNNFKHCENISRNNMSHQFSMSNAYYLNFSNKILDQTYIFNFASGNDIDNNIFHGNCDLKKINELDNKTPLRKFDFKNLPFSPIPKPQHSEEVQNNKVADSLFPIFPETKRKTGTTWRRYVSEGEFCKISSPYFSKKGIINTNENSFSTKNIGFPQKIAEKENKKKFFRRFHTEPPDDSRLQYIQKTKKNIDKLFLNIKCNKFRENMNENIIYAKEKENISVFTRDSLEEYERNLQIKTPLWKKFIRDKNKIIKSRKKSKELSLSKIGENNVIVKYNSNYFKHKTSAIEENIGESPDLFPGEMTNEKPMRDLTFLHNSAISFDVDAIFDDKKDDCKDLRTLTAVDTAKSSNLIISLNQKDEMANNEDLDTDGNLLVENEWIRRLDQDGKEFYFNERTGMTSFLYPKKEDIYVLKQRSDFIPKGLSPIMVPSRKLDKTLSPISKEKLHEEILKSYKEELGVVKWEKCIRGYDPNEFFENLYRERVNEYEKEVPNLIRSKITKYSMSEINHFTKMVFKDLKVIGQIDQKFIAAIDCKKFNLIIFDQHAVHERIRLEDLLKEYDGKSSTCENVTLFMKQTEIDLMRNHEKYFNSVGLYFIFFKNGIIVNKVPLSLSNKISKEFSLPKLIQLLVRETLDQVKDTRGVLTGLPKMLNQIINMEACRGSVKFGESLTRDEMTKFIEKLSQCILPFQCAHGRPTLTPLLTLNNRIEENIEKPKLQNLKPRI